MSIIIMFVMSSRTADKLLQVLVSESMLGSGLRGTAALASDPHIATPTYCCTASALTRTCAACECPGAAICVTVALSASCGKTCSSARRTSR